MCGKDEARREVYKPKEEPEKWDRKKKRKRKWTKKERKKRREREREERKKGKCWDLRKKNTCETDLILETGLEGNLGGK